MKRNQSGFTLIEIAIVLVIIGLLLGGVLKGQELINSAKVKNMAIDFKNIPVFIYGYQDKHRALPGDDGQADKHVTGGTVCTPALANKCAPNNGLIDGAWDADVADIAKNESLLFWQHVRLAGMLTGTTDIADSNFLPTNSNGGRLGVQSNINFTTITKNAAGVDSLIAGTYIICSSGILGKYVRHLDSTLDNGDTDTGTVRAIKVGAADAKSVASNAIVDAETYTVCMGI
jgi:prepilin-type N-terminal cleavage/methylation domain-containing protein